MFGCHRHEAAAHSAVDILTVRVKLEPSNPIPLQPPLCCRDGALSSAVPFVTELSQLGRHPPFPEVLQVPSPHSIPSRNGMLTIHKGYTLQHCQGFFSLGRSKAAWESLSLLCPPQVSICNFSSYNNPTKLLGYCSK